MSKSTTLQQSDVATRIRVQDLARARAFYSEKLGIGQPVY
jgi:extradiol dioxygenase family protein